MSAITVRPLRDDLSFGSIITGVTHEALADEAVRAEIRDTFEKRGMIVFKGVEPTSKMHVALSEVFGPLKDHPTKTTGRTAEDLAPGVIDMHYIPNPDDPTKGEGLVEKGGKVLARYSPWHFDHCYQDELNYAGVLRAPINAPEGGRTGFVDGIDMYRIFPKDLLAKLERLNVLYTLDTRLSKMRHGVDFTHLTEHSSTASLLAEAAKFPRAIHPAVWTRDSGEKVLHFAGWMAVGVEDHEDEAGHALLDEAVHTLNRLATGAHVYWHDWEATDMVIWDNLRMLHAVEGCDARYERRTLRTTIRGDYGHGRFEHGKKIGEVNRLIEA